MSEDPTGLTIGQLVSRGRIAKAHAEAATDLIEAMIGPDADELDWPLVMGGQPDPELVAHFVAHLIKLAERLDASNGMLCLSTADEILFKMLNDYVIDLILDESDRITASQTEKIKAFREMRVEDYDVDALWEEGGMEMLTHPTMVALAGYSDFRPEAWFEPFLYLEGPLPECCVVAGVRDPRTDRIRSAG